MAGTGKSPVSKPLRSCRQSILMLAGALAVLSLFPVLISESLIRTYCYFIIIIITIIIFIVIVIISSIDI